MKRILILGGGGVRGAIQLAPLETIEHNIGKKISEYYDLIIGSSVGAITGGMLATGKITAREYTRLFCDLVPNIFRKRFFSFGLLRPKYDRKCFYEIFNNIFGAKTLMKDCKTKFICTSVNLCDMRTHFFKSWEDKDGNLSLKESIARSFAAPYYFGMIIDTESKSLWIDGGTGSENCPIDMAYIESIRQGWMQNDDVEFTIIGTGYTNNTLDFSKGKDMGSISQVLKFLSPGDGGLARIQSLDSAVNRIKSIDIAYKNMTVKYYNVEIPEKIDALDKVNYLNEYLMYGSILTKEIQ